MVQQVIDVGTSASDGTGDPLRDAFTKINDNFTELYSTVDNEGLTYGNIASNVAGITFNVTRYTESYAATPVLRGTGQAVGNVYVIRGNVLGGTTPLNDVFLTVTTLANATVGNVATVSAVGIPTAPVLRVNGLTGNVTLTVNNIDGAASKAYVNAAIASNVANVTGSVTDSLRANINAANAVINNHSSRITTLEANSASQAVQINNLVSVKANVSYVDSSIDNALSGNAILANVAAVNANVAAANAAILLRANLSGANFSGNISANSISASNYIRTDTYFIGGSEINQGQGQSWANPAALFFGNTSGQANRYFQLNLQNLDPQGSGDIVITADDGNDQSNFVSLGMTGSQGYAPLYPSAEPHDAYVWVTGGNLDLQSETGNVEIISGNIASGQIIVTQSNIIKLGTSVRIQFSDGTIQSTAFGGNANLTSINANITAANIAISNLQSNAAVQALDIDLLVANAGMQSVSISNLTSNAGAQSIAINLVNANLAAANTNINNATTSINLLNANVTAANTNISSLIANATTQALELNNLQSNTQTQQADIISLQSNASTQAVAINFINANIIAANTNITTMTSNAATQAVQINAINANLTAANTSITSLTSNAATQALQLDNLNTNVNFYLANVSSVNANVAAANLRISSLEANVLAVNIQIANKANISGAIFSGNVQAPYLIANANVKINSTLEVGNLTPINYPGLGAVFVGNVDSYYQVVVHNLSSGANASSDFVLTADDGTDENNYINIGINSSGFQGNFVVPAGDTGLVDYAHDGYITVIGGNAALRGDQSVFLAANTAIVGLFKDGNFGLLNANLGFSDGSVQSTAITNVPDLYANIGTLRVNVNTLGSNVSTLDANLGVLATNFTTLDANVGFMSNIGNVAYTPNNVANYFGSVTTIQQALDQLAARISALGG